MSLLAQRIFGTFFSLLMFMFVVLSFIDGGFNTVSILSVIVGIFLGLACCIGVAMSVAVKPPSPSQKINIGIVSVGVLLAMAILGVARIFGATQNLAAFIVPGLGAACATFCLWLGWFFKSPYSSNAPKYIDEKVRREEELEWRAFEEKLQNAEAEWIEQQRRQRRH
nr:hypothetical protein [Oscillochloris trichoides]